MKNDTPWSTFFAHFSITHKAGRAEQMQMWNENLSSTKQKDFQRNFRLDSNCYGSKLNEIAVLIKQNVAVNGEREIKTNI